MTKDEIQARVDRIKLDAEESILKDVPPEVKALLPRKVPGLLDRLKEPQE